MIATATTSVRLRHPEFDFDVVLSLARAPRFLRFAYTAESTCNRHWDALDQLDDEPSEGEQLVAGVRVRRGSMHVSYTEKGRRKGEWWPNADYELVSPQPAQETMHDRDRWREWCLQQPKESA